MESSQWLICWNQDSVDAIDFSHALIFPTDDREAVDGIFHTITCDLQMMKAYLRPETGFKGISEYIKTKKNKTAVSKDFFHV